VNTTILKAIKAMLDSAGVDYKSVSHGPTLTSKESAAARGEEIKIGGKALLIKVDKRFALFVLSAALRLDSKALRKELKARKSRFASPDELAEMTGLVPGSVPPFGEPILPFDLYLDPSILGNEKIAFNAGSLCDSIIFNVEDYLQLAKPLKVFQFSKS
jgi:Ala-tRNA(Pro) deacylase